MSNRRLIAVDIGNSATKVGWFDGSQKPPPDVLPRPIAAKKFTTGDAPPSALMESLPAEPCDWRIVSVHRDGTRLLLEWLKANRPSDVAHVLVCADLPIELRVDYPERVGLDRVAAAVAANVLRTADQPTIVIGAGSAITVNLVSAGGAFEGGVILPGFRMSAEALYGADMLPLAVLAPNDE